MRSQSMKDEMELRKASKKNALLPDLRRDYMVGSSNPLEEGSSCISPLNFLNKISFISNMILMNSPRSRS